MIARQLLVIMSQAHGDVLSFGHGFFSQTGHFILLILINFDNHLATCSRQASESA